MGGHDARFPHRGSLGVPEEHRHTLGTMQVWFQTTHHNKEITAVNWVTPIFGFLVPVTVMFILSCHLLSVQSIMSRKQCTYLKKYFIAKKSANHHRLSLQRAVIFLLVKGLKYCESYQSVMQRHEVSKCCRKKRVPTALLDAGLPQTFNFPHKNAMSARCNKARSACTMSAHHPLPMKGPL